MPWNLRGEQWRQQQQHHTEDHRRRLSSQNLQRSLRSQATPCQGNCVPGGSSITPTPQDPPECTKAMEEAPSHRRLRIHQHGQERWRNLHHANAARPARIDRNAGGSPSMPTFQDSPKWTGTMGEARHADDSGSTKMDRNDGGSPITPTPQDPPRWTGTMGEAPSLRRLRTHLDGQELWGKPQHADASGPS